MFTAMHEYLEKAQEAGLSLCIDCKRCVEACAVGIKTPAMIARLQGRPHRAERPAGGQESGVPGAFGRQTARLGQAGEVLSISGSERRR